MTGEDTAEPLKICALPGCSEPVSPAEDGSERRYCSRTHRAQARRLRRLSGELGRSGITATIGRNAATASSAPSTEAAEPAAPREGAARTTGASGAAGAAVGDAGDGDVVVPQAGPATSAASSRRRQIGWPVGVSAAAVVAAAAVLAVLLRQGGEPKRPGGPHAAARPVATATATVTVTPSVRVTVSHVAESEPEPPDTGGSAGRPGRGTSGFPAARPGRSTSSGSGAGSGFGSAGVRAGGSTQGEVAALSGVQYGFESGRQGWSIFYGDESLSIRVATSPIYQGSHALRLSVVGSDYSATGVDHPPGVRGGTTVTYRIWTDGTSPGNAVPFAQDTGYKNHFVNGAAISLSAHRGWRTVRWTVPSISVLAIGLQVHGTGGHGTLALDAVTW